MTDKILKPEPGGNPRAAQVRIGTRSATAIGGQRNHDLRMGPQPAYVDTSLSAQNRVLITPETGGKLRKISEERRALRDTKRAMKSNAAVATAGIITFGHQAQKLFEKLTPDQQDAAYLELGEAVATRLNTNLTGLVVHVDETAPHAHFQLPGYDRAGFPISETAKRGVLRELQDITAEVMGRHCPGIERGNSKQARLQAGATPAEVVNRSVKQLRDEAIPELEAKVAAKQVDLDEMTAKLQNQERLLSKAHADLDRAIAETGAESAKVEKIRNRAAKYESRAEKAKASLGAIQEDLDRLRGVQAKLTAENDRLHEAVAQKKTKIDSLRTRLQSLNAA